MPSTFVAYALWLVGGWWGLHLHYLGREKQAYLMASSCGGLGLGFLRDFFKIPTYVAEVRMNLEVNYQKSHQELKMQQSSSPPWRFIDLIAKFVFALLFGSMGSALVKVDYLTWFEVMGDNPPYMHVRGAVQSFLFILGSAFGVWFVANCSPYKSAAFLPILKAGTMAFLLFKLFAFFDIMTDEWLEDEEEDTGNGTSFFLVVVVASIAACGRCAVWNPNFAAVADTSRPHGCVGWLRRLGKMTFVHFLVAVTFFLVLILSVEVTSENGKKVLVVDSIRNMMKSPAWLQFWASVGLLWNQCSQSEGGWGRCWEKFAGTFDVGGDKRALELLGLDPGRSDYSKAEIKKAYRKKAVRFHPDKVKNQKDQAAKKAAEEKFAEVADAFNLLMETYGDDDDKKKANPSGRRRRSRTTAKKRGGSKKGFHFEL